MNGSACRGFDPYGAIISTGRWLKTLVYESAKQVFLFVFLKAYPVLLMLENYNNWVHRNYYVCLLNKPIEL